MSLVCAQCSRTNPSDAAFCWNDGAALAGRATGPVDAGSTPFLRPFVFPSGAICRNFDQLAMACQHHAADAIQLMQLGHLGAFLGSIGRGDLARVAQEAARFPDAQRGLDQLLGKLPTRALEPAKLQVEPRSVNLGQLKVGEDRVTHLKLKNTGMRLLIGTVTSDSKWLTVGDGAGSSEKMFQVDGESMIPIRVRGKHLRAGTKPLDGKLTVESNGGAATITIRVDVPITPFPGGPFNGAVTPRQIAEASKLKPKDAAPYFEGGSVADWYARNGWQYPVQGPAMPGVAGIQQFFEALGVTKPPPVIFAPAALDFQGTPGQVIQTGIAVTAVNTEKRKAAYGWARANATWVEIGKTDITKKNAIIPITLRIPTASPSLLTASVTVVGNGNQSTVVPVRVSVTNGTIPVAVAAQDIDVDLVDVPMPAAVSAPLPLPTAVAAGPAAVALAPLTPSFTNAPATNPAAPFAIDSTQVLASHRLRRQLTTPQLVARFGPLLLLFLFVTGIGVRDYKLAPNDIPIDLDPEGSKKGELVKELPAYLDDVDVRAQVLIKFDEGVKPPDYTDSMTFAVHKVGMEGRGDIKLNWYDNGFGNSTVLRVNGADAVFGDRNFGYWNPKLAKTIGPFGGKTRTFVLDGSGIQVTQTVTLEPGEPVAVGGGKFKRPLSIALARYTLENKTGETHEVGLRTLLDTCIGENDGAPFLVPGLKDLITAGSDFKGTDVPDFVEVYEKPDLKDPGVVARLNMRLAQRFEMPSRFVITHYPEATTRIADLKRWDVRVADIGADSCVVLYWDEKPMRPKEVRELGFSYGLGNLSATGESTVASKRGSLGLTIGGARYVGGELTVVALVADRDATKATLSLPAGLALVDQAKPLAQPVPRSSVGPGGRVRPVPVSWRVRATREGRHEVSVATDSNLRQAQTVTINLRSLFN